MPRQKVSFSNLDLSTDPDLAERDITEIISKGEISNDETKDESKNSQDAAQFGGSEQGWAG